MQGICFKEPLLNATVEGWKIQTRRLMEPQPGTYCTKCKKSYIVCECEFDSDNHANRCTKTVSMETAKPRYKVGEIIYLKEPYCVVPEYDGERILYKFSGDTLPCLSGDLSPYEDDFTPTWKNKLFMPAKAARYFIRIIAVRAERLQDINEHDCFREGIREYIKDRNIKYGIDGWKWQGMFKTPREAYAALIDEINGKGTWESNPFMWVYDYELTSKPTGL